MCDEYGRNRDTLEETRATATTKPRQELVLKRYKANKHGTICTTGPFLTYFGPFLTYFSAPYHRHTHRMACSTWRFAHACWMLIGTCNPMHTSDMHTGPIQV